MRWLLKARGLFLVALCVLLLPRAAQAQNNTAVTAASYMVGEGWIDVSMGGLPNNQRWYKYLTYAGRSYCAEGVAEKRPIMDYDGETTVFRGDGITPIGRADDNVQEPGGGVGSVANGGRVCYIAPATEANYLRVGNLNLTQATITYQWRVVETTQFCPWFFSGNGFEAFILIKNTTYTAVNATVKLRSTGGAVLGTKTATVPPNGSLNLQVSNPSDFNLPSASGSVEIAYGAVQTGTLATNDGAGAGGPGALLANVTSLSFTSGVSFDTPAAPRQDFVR